MQVPKPVVILRIITSLILILAITPPLLAGDVDHPALGEFVGQMDRLVMTPGASSSVAAGLINPAAWPILGRGGFYLGWEEPATEAEGDSDLDDLSAVMSGGNLGLGLRYRSLEHPEWGDLDHYDYTVGLGFGDRSNAFGVSYTWSRGALASFGSVERLKLGAIKRWRVLSLGVSTTKDFENDQLFYQGDLGIRPFGPRLTLFGGASYLDSDDMAIPDSDGEYDPLVLSYGAEVQILPGLTIAAGGRDSGELSLRLDLAFSAENPDNPRAISRSSGRVHFDDGQEYASTTIAVEGAEGPQLGMLFARPKRFPEMHLKGSMSYRNFRYFDDRRRFLSTMQQIDGYAQNRAVGGVLINLSGFRTTPANLWELRAQLAGLRAEGKKVVVYFDRLELFGYMLASVADEIWMDPLGDLDIKGLTLGRTYLRRMLDKMGIGIDEWRFFTYKSALEGFSRTSMSDPDREQFQAFMEDWFEAAAGQALEARGLSREEWDDLMNDKGELLPTEALAAGLVDKLGDFHEAQEAAKDAKRRSTGDSVVAPLATLMGDPIWGPEEWGEPPSIAVLYAIGGCSMDTGIKGRQLSKVIRGLRDAGRVKAVVMRSDSPGGDALPSDLVSRELKLTQDEKPVVISQGQVAASGGYWISMHSDAILASPLTLTGSIGVISGHIWNNGLGDKIGMDYDQVKIGEHSDIWRGPYLPFIGASIPHRPVTAEERARGEFVMKDLYKDFTAQVAEGRGMTREEIDAIGQGRVWSGSDGLEIGLVDEIGGLWTSIVRAKERAGIPAHRPVKLAEGPELGMLNPAIFQPSFFGLTLPFFRGEAKAEESLLSGDPWDRLSGGERIYLEQILLHNGEPLVLMPPLSIEGVTLDP